MTRLRRVLLIRSLQHGRIDAAAMPTDTLHGTTFQCQ
jgi:hypothetical protein